MANTFKLTTRDVAPASSGTPEEIYDCPDSTTSIILGLTLANVHTSQVTASVTLVSTTNQSGSTQNTTAHLIKDVPIPVGSTVVPPLPKDISTMFPFPSFPRDSANEILIFS